MDLSEEERYALAALFTLALHATQYDRGNATEQAWGQPPDLEAQPWLLARLDEAGLEAFWGYDCVAARGLLERVYRTLALPATKWRGLQALPVVAPSTAAGDSFRAMVRSLIEVLDPELAAALPPLLLRQPPSRRRQQTMGSTGSLTAAGDEGEEGGPPLEVEASSSPPAAMTAAGSGPRIKTELPADALFDGLLNDASDDEDWRADLERERQVQARLEQQAAGAAGLRQTASPPERQLRHQQTAAVAATNLSADFANKACVDGGPLGRATAVSEGRGSGSTTRSRTGSSRSTSPGKSSSAAPPTPRVRADASRKGVAAVLALLQCCVGESPGEDSSPSSPAGSPGQQQPAQGPLPRVRWYDARARVALKEVAGWLHLTPAQVSSLEVLLTSDKAPATKGYTPAEEDSWSKRMRYLKVGAAAVGGGALFAVTGGLAAPAIAAGIMSILPAIGAPAIVASSVATLGTAGGVAFTTSAIGGAGAATFGTRMAHRVGNVAEFGFRELRPPPEVPPQSLSSSSRNASGSRLASEAQPQALSCNGSHGGSSSRLEEEGAAGRAAGAAGGLAGASASATADEGDPGHLTLGRAGVQRRPASAPLLVGTSSSSRVYSQVGASSSASSSAGGLATTSGRGVTSISSDDWQLAAAKQAAEHAQLLQAQQAAARAAASAQPSAWQRWFGGSASSSAQEEQGPPALLPVPIRERPGGDTKLSVVIGVAGWVAREDDFQTTWSCLRVPDADVFSLVWESAELLKLNSALGSLVAMQATGQGVQLAVHSFFYAGAGLVAALGPTVLVGAASGLLINNSWQVASDRAVKAGKLLAELLEAGAHGDRPVSLVGHGMGARLIFSCLLELCRRGCRGVVEHAVLMGAPVETAPERWAMARRAVAGRLVNCYSRRDWLLGVCYGGSTGWMRAAAGLVPIESVAGVENCNLSRVAEGHFSYLENMQDILLGLGLFA